jgi:septal ring factor EnvC (AmiA/AmiB activator)
LTELRQQRDELAKTAAQNPQLEQEITALTAEIESLSAAMDAKRRELQELTKTSAPLRNGQPVTAFASVEVVLRLQ